MDEPYLPTDRQNRVYNLPLLSGAVGYVTQPEREQGRQHEQRLEAEAQAASPS
jgi:hypothetical protein